MRSILIVLALLIALPAAWGLPDTQQAAASVHVSAKKHCKTVKKHGKKAKVCTKAKPKPTATPTDTPVPTATATPTSTPPPTATATPIPTSTPVPPTLVPTPRSFSSDSFVLDFNHPPSLLLTDPQTNVAVDVIHIVSGLDVQHTNDSGQPIPAGQIMLRLKLGEMNLGSQPYQSTYANFRMVAADGTVYPAVTPGNIQSFQPPMYPKVITTGMENLGLVEFVIPTITPTTVTTFNIMWNENGAIPWTTAISVRIDSGDVSVRFSGHKQP